MLHRGDRARGGVDRVDDGIVQVAAHQPVDVAVQGGREEHPLPARTHLVEQGGDLRHEAHVGHLVGLVEDGDGDVAQPAVAPVDEVLEPAGRRHDHLGPGAQRAGLPADGHAADDGGQPQVHGAGVGGERVGDLLGELAGGDEDESERSARLGTASRRTGQRGEAEGEGLSRAGAAAAEDVTAGQRVRQRGRLDRERDGHALLAQRGQQLCGHVEFGERLDRGQGRRDRPGRCELALYGLSVSVRPGTTVRTTGAAAGGV